MKLLGILLGFTFAIIGLIIAIHSTHWIVGLLISFGGLFTCLNSLPPYDERVLWVIIIGAMDQGATKEIQQPEFVVSRAPKF